MNRRDFIRLAATSGFLFTASGVAQATGSVCSFTRLGQVGAATLPATSQAINIVEQIKSALNYTGQIQIYQTTAVANAAAFPANLYGPFPIIAYNPHFLNKLYSLHPMAPVSVLAHEIGHFTPQGSFAPNAWTRELTSDYVSGCAMKRLGADEQGATAALKAMFNVYGSPTHPDTPKRLSAMGQGYNVCA